MKTRWISGIIAILLVIGLGLASPVAAEDDKDGKINLNTATKEQLVGIGLDEAIVDEILSVREENDEFVDIEELTEIDGIDAKLLRQLKKKVYIEAVAGCNC
jgi:competence protein ComEA